MFLQHNGGQGPIRCDVHTEYGVRSTSALLSKCSSVTADDYAYAVLRSNAGEHCVPGHPSMFPTQPQQRTTSHLIGPKVAMTLPQPLEQCGALSQHEKLLHTTSGITTTEYTIVVQLSSSYGVRSTSGTITEFTYVRIIRSRPVTTRHKVG